MKQQRYYHGTWDGHADSIMQRGFELGHEGLGNALGRGVYLAPDLESAALWARNIVIICKLQPATRILWVDGQYDRRIIDRLRREFGKDLLDLGPAFAQAIPANKQLTHGELINLCAYIIDGQRRFTWRTILAPHKGSRASRRHRWGQIAELHGQIRRYGYDALGDRSRSAWDANEIVIFNPARVEPLSAHALQRDADDAPYLGSPLSAQRLTKLAKHARATV